MARRGITGVINAANGALWRKRRRWLHRRLAAAIGGGCRNVKRNISNGGGIMAGGIAAGWRRVASRAGENVMAAGVSACMWRRAIMARLASRGRIACKRNIVKWRSIGVLKAWRNMAAAAALRR